MYLNLLIKIDIAMHVCNRRYAWYACFRHFKLKDLLIELKNQEHVQVHKTIQIIM